MSDNLFDCSQEKAEGANADNNFPNSLQQQLSDYNEIIKVERRKYLMSKLLYDLTKESLMSEDNGLEKDLSQRFLDVFTLEEMGNDLNGLTLLGLKRNKTAFNYDELQQLKNLTEDRITKFANEVLKYDRNLIGTENADVESKLLSEFNRKLSRIEETYLKGLSEESTYLSDIIKLRTQVLPEVANRKVEEAELTIKMNHLKSNLLLEKTKVNIFMETEKSLQAYKELIKDMDALKIKLEGEIKDLQLLKEKYRQVNCKEYESILKSYIQLKTSLEQQRCLYQQLNKK